jgi:uncharacterized protein
MSDLLDDARRRKETLKHMILQLHDGKAPDEVRSQLVQLLGSVPYNDVVEVEQELIAEGLPEEEVIKLCDIHSQALHGTLDLSQAKTAPPGHPADTFIEENRALQWEIKGLNKLYELISESTTQAELLEILIEIKERFNALMDVEVHYSRKENLLFPFLEKHEITGPSTVMWGKHDQTRDLLKKVMEALAELDRITPEQMPDLVENVLKPTSAGIDEMIFKEEQILLPMSLDNLSDTEWYEIYQQSPEIGFCLFDPAQTWKPENLPDETVETDVKGRVLFPSGSLSAAELTGILNTVPCDMTFVDKDDRVRFFTQGKERIFTRNRAIIGRKVQQCHPMSSVDVVEKILDDFKSGKEEQAAFWIEMNEQFIHIEYFAVKDENGDYLGCLEVSQDLTEKRKLEGQQRLLDYSK